MRILFVGRNFGYFRNFESVLRSLAARGHAIHLAVEREESGGGRQMIEALVAEHPNVTFGDAPVRAEDEWEWVASRLRLGLDYLRYQHPLFDDAPKLRARARERTPGAFVALGDRVRSTARWSRRGFAALIRRLERAVPDDPRIRAFIEEQRPDVVLLTPLIDLGSSQIDYLRAARALGVPTALCVWSWDHLSSKALIRECPDRVFVWNDTQKREAMELHGIPAERVVVTGAQCFDRWFDREPSRDRETFCREIGLPADRPFLLYVCSALFYGSPIEARFVVEWIQRIRASESPTLRSIPILVRPHPSRMPEWNEVDASRLAGVAIRGGNPIDARSRADYFDALYYSAVVVGLNTSAFIEAGIVGRPVHTILLPEFQENQMGTVHFRYLLNAGGGLLQVAHGWDEHLRQLESSLIDPPAGISPFVREFVRPRGLDVPATPVFVDQVEGMAGSAHPSRDVSAPLSRFVLERLTARRDDRSWERWLYSERELEGMIRLREAQAEKSRVLADAERQREEARKQVRMEERRQREAEKQRRVAAEKASRDERIREKERLRSEKRARTAARAEK